MRRCRACSFGVNVRAHRALRANLTPQGLPNECRQSGMLKFDQGRVFRGLPLGGPPDARKTHRRANLDDLKRQIRALAPGQRAELRVYLDGLAQLDSGGGAFSTSGLAAWFGEQCARLGLGTYLGSQVRASLNKHSTDLERFLDGACPDSPQIIRHGILTTGLELLAAELRRKAVPLNPTVLARNLGNLPGALDRAFPGYAKMGLLASIIHNQGVPNA